MVTILTTTEWNAWMDGRRKRLAERQALNRRLKLLIVIQLTTVVVMVAGIILRVYGHS